MAALEVSWASTTTPTWTARALWDFHLLAESTGPAIVGFTVEDVLGDLVPND